VNSVGDDEVSELRLLLAAAADRVRHPNLSLTNFVSRESAYADNAGAGDPDAAADRDGDEETSIPAEERKPARLRRAAVAVAATEIIDRCIDDLQVVEFDEDGQLGDPDETEDTFVWEAFPPRYRDAYDEAFFRRVLVTAVKVAQDLADPHGGPAACTAEEIIRRAIGGLAMRLWEITGLGPALLHPDELLLEDADFELLYDEAFDGLENDPAMQAGMNVEVPRLHDWFAPFNDRRVVHPYTETPRSPDLSLHDLRQRLDDIDQTRHDLLDAAVVDAPEPVSSLAPASEIVGLARQASDPTEPDLWIADDTAPEQSFAALVAAAHRTDRGNGWLTWEPYDGANTVRTDAVVLFAPHRHFPIGQDEPWADAALGGGRLVAVPLKYVVSYQPDPDVRRWNDALAF
jgi:hypothetical protein